MIKLTSILRENINSYILRENSFELGDEDFELAKGLNVTYLNVGDYITNDMWNPDSDDFFHTDEPSLISAIGIDHDGPYVKFSNYLPLYELEEINDNLRSEYQIEEPINESFELGDEDFELVKGLNVKLLTINDTITPDMWASNGGGVIPTKEPLYIKSFGEDYEGVYVTLYRGENNQDFGDLISVDLDEIHDYLKPEYQVGLPLYEDFELGDDDLELARGFNQKELKVGNVYNEHLDKVWDNKNDMTEYEKNYVGSYEVLYIGPNTGKYNEPNYYDNDIIVVKPTYIDDDEKIFKFIPKYWNELYGDKFNVYVPIKNDLDE